MSSILEALERAEKERNPADKQSFIDSELAKPAVLRRRGIWLFVGFLLLINLLIWFWVLLRTDDSSNRETIASTEQTQQQKPLATAETVVAILEQPMAGKQRKTDPPLLLEAHVADEQSEPRISESLISPKVATDPASPSASMPPLVPIAPPKPEPVSMEMPAESVAPVLAPSRVKSATQAAKVAPAVVAAVDPAPSVASPTDTAVPKPAEPSPLPREENASEEIPSLWELPANLQQKLSGLKINIHVYTDDAAQRFVIINMRKYREGDRLEPSGMQLERITRKGIVINHGQGLVRL
jgi:general secretion pathway protein B